ncbi:carbon starvation CstA family protein [Botrimarina hoheduenensis]|uniref:Carbon starvation protein A n=1 Tax=Botrimarina hoheduenensis TaxID=2528000 RepID=A0A5C5WAY0_9BACT|nr:carbon starvation protein A [Botrimarina hoheduenensis]TWT47325.1 Carbon starvation protein A [Botrimarina hoheduenensis]
MLTILVAVGSFAALLLAYRWYGGWLARYVFKLDAGHLPPSHTLRDGVDFVPTAKSVVFGHHFTSIAGTGPIVGPAIAVFWGWLPAVLWVVLGSIFIGAVHDLGALVVSLRNQGKTIGEAAGSILSPRARVLFLVVLFFSLTIVIGIFGLVIAMIFGAYPESVLSVWTAMPLAIAIGWGVLRRGGGLLIPSLAALALLYATVGIGTYWLPINMPTIAALDSFGTPVVLWTVVLLVYCYFASVLPVWLLLQPRDYINSLQLLVAMALLVTGLFVAGATGAADLNAAPMLASEIPADAPPIMPFLFITIACGACSGFHCLVASGTTSKQIASEPDALSIGYGGMLTEGALAVVVILACCAGLGMGVNGPDGERLVGRAAWEAKYPTKITTVTDSNGMSRSVGGWANQRLIQNVGAFVEGGANFLTAIYVPPKLAVATIAVLVACFAATTLDTATRLQRYVIQELATTLKPTLPWINPLRGKHPATLLAVVAGGAVAMIPGPAGPGSGGLILWPLFGATNQLLAGLSFLVIVFFLARQRLPIGFALVPMALMLVMPAWAMIEQIKNDFAPNWHTKWPLLAFGVGLLVLQVWMMLEALLAWPKVRRLLQDPPDRVAV